MVKIDIIIPSNATIFNNSLFKILSFLPLGFSFNKLPLLFSIPMAMAGMLSVNKFMNNRCTAANGIGRLIIAQ